MSNFWKNFDFGRNLKDIDFFREFGKIIDFGQIFETNFDFGQNWRKFRKMSILVKFSKNFDFGHNFRKISSLVKFFQKISILVNIFENCEKCRFCQIFVKFRFYSKFTKNGDFFENFQKFRFWSNFEKLSILVRKFSKKIRILVIIFEKLWFWSNF